MDWGFFPPLADLLAARGFAALRFNFSGAGMEPGDERVTDLEAFRRNTLSREVEELLTVIEEGPGLAPERIPADPVGVLGHSRGGGVAILAAARDRARDRIGALVTWNAIGSVERWSRDEAERWRDEGVHWIENSRTGQRLPLGVELLEDVEENREKLDIAAAARERVVPWLLVHAEEDESVSVDEARELAAEARSPVELEIIEGTGHTFGAGHPFRGPTPALIRAMNRAQGWFRQWLRAGSAVE